MSQTQMVCANDVRKLIRLVCDLRDVPTVEGKNHLFASRLADLFHAKVIFVVRGEEVNKRGAGTFSMLAEGGSIDSAERRIYDMYWTGEFESDPAWLNMMPHVANPVVFRKDELVNAREWYNSAHYNEYRRANRLDEFMYVSSPVSTNGAIYAIGINREIGDPPFGEREKTMMKILNDELHTFYNASCPPVKVPLPKRERQVLERMLHGDSEQRTAELLGISHHTVHAYVKKLYKQFNVNSRPELMSQMLFKNAE
ncbi:MAG: helix-turn-helix transcriptional regulator [Phycisphaerae bacterium]